MILKIVLISLQQGLSSTHLEKYSQRNNNEVKNNLRNTNNAITVKSDDFEIMLRPLLRKIMASIFVQNDR